MLKMRSIPTEGKQIAQMKEWPTKTRSMGSNIPAIPYGTRDCATENSQRYSSSNTVQPPQPRLDHSDSDFSENREESQIVEPLCTDGTTLENAPYAPYAQCTPYAPGTSSQHARTLESQPRCLVTNFTSKDTIAPGLVDCHLKMVSFELYTYFIVF